MATFNFDNRHGRNRFKIDVREADSGGGSVDADDIRQILRDLKEQIDAVGLEPAQNRRAKRHVATIEEELEAEDPSVEESRNAIERIGDILAEFAGAGVVVQGCMDALQRLIRAFQF